ncbi:MAG: radical SAM protein [Pseudanabaena sp.]|nr:MAG: radical SAM protein [Pseudanabaena sp.]
MDTVRGTETVASPLQESALRKKGLCDYVINVASGCLHGCTFCYVPSTPVIRTRQAQLALKGVDNPQMDWGKYLFVREGIAEQLEETLSRKKTWKTTESGQGVVMLCSGTDPYQNHQTATITRQVVKVLLKYDKRVRILTRSPLWINDIDILRSKNVTVGMSLPMLDDELSRKIEPAAPLPSDRYKAMMKGYEAGIKLYVAIAPTPPTMQLQDFQNLLQQVMKFEPEVIFWEPINARGTNGKRMLEAGLDFVRSVTNRDSWADNFIQQWQDIEQAANNIGCKDLLHIWVDPELRGFVEDESLDYWLFRKTVEDWDNDIRKSKTSESKLSQAVQKLDQAIRKQNKFKKGTVKLVAS